MMSSIKVGVIAAAGKGTRAYPRTSFIPKPLFTFSGKTLLERNVELQVRAFKVKKLYILVGHLKEAVIEEVERIRKKFPALQIETSPWTGKGLAADVASLRDRIDGDFSLVLGDEFYYNTNHSVIPQRWTKKKGAKAMIACLRTDFMSEIRKNYSVELKGDRVVRLYEKPELPPNSILGLGTYLFSRDYFNYFDTTPPSQRSGVVELTDVIDRMANETGRVYAEVLTGRYFNINSLADYYTATYLIRTERFTKYRISLVIPSLNNQGTLPDVIHDFKKHVDEILVVDMGSTDRTLSLIRGSGARVISGGAKENRVGVHYGISIYQAMREAKGDIVVLVTADGSYRAKDLPKLLEYLKDSDMVVGTRTTRQLMEQGSNLSARYRWLNVFFGKLVEILWWDQEPRFTDIGCYYRAIWKESFDKIDPDLSAKNKTFSVEMMIEIMRYHMRCVEIPISFYRRYGAVMDDTLSVRWDYFFSVLKMMFTRRFLRRG